MFQWSYGVPVLPPAYYCTIWVEMESFTLPALIEPALLAAITVLDSEDE